MTKKRQNKPLLPKPGESLVEIKKLVNIVATQIAFDRIEKSDWTEKQKAIWFLCSGKLTRKQLAQKSGVHLNTVKAFVEEAMTYGLLEEEKAKGGHPKRVIDYAPSEWKSYIKKKKAVKESEKTETTEAKQDEKQRIEE
jgi:transposase